MAHAKLSPSGAHRWMACPGSVVLEAEYPDDSSSYAAEGTCAHNLAAAVLTDPEYVIPVWEHFTIDGYTIKVTQAMADYVMDYCKLVWEYSEGRALFVEQFVPIDHLTGETGATGTSDAVIVDTAQEALTVIDLKYGMGVAVSAQDNEQLMMYALGALEAFGLAGDFSYVTMVIHQPRLNVVSEWNVPVHELREFALRVREAAYTVDDAVNLRASYENWDSEYLEPGEKQCRFCKAKATCPALRAGVTEIAGGSAVATAEDFAQFLPDEPDSDTGDNYLSIAMSKVGLVEDWCKAVRAEVERRLLAGKTVDGFKLVTGKRGPRKWSDEKAVEKLFKSFRLKQDEMYEYSLISPTKAEKVLTSARWDKAQGLVTQTAGKPSVAPATDKRPALVVSDIAEEFRELVNTGKLEN